jgi:hypothetical protein
MLLNLDGKSASLPATNAMRLRKGSMVAAHGFLSATTQVWEF